MSRSRTSRSTEGDEPERATEQLGGRFRSAHRALDPDQRVAGAAAALLGASVFLPWWRDPILDFSYVGVRRLTFVEVAILLVAAAVLVLLLGRAERRPFHLPFSDGSLIAAAGAWAVFLVSFRILDPPTRTVAGVTSDYDLRWGAFVALTAAVVLALSGARLRRRRHRGEPESVAADEDATATLQL